MRITMEPTDKKLNGARSGSAAQHSIVIEHPQDDLDLSVVLELIESALRAYGYSPDGILDFYKPE